MSEQTKVTFFSETKSFLKKNMYLIFGCTISILYVLRALFEFKYTGKTIVEIVADSILIFICGIIVDFLFGSQGISDGRNSEGFLKAESRFEEQTVLIRPYFDELSDFCKYKNEIALKSARMQILMEYGYRYSDFFEEDGCIKPFSLTGWENAPKREQKRRLKAYKKATTFKITMLNVPFLVSDLDSTRDPHATGRSVRKFMSAQTRSDVIWKTLIAVFLGYLGVQLLRDFSVANFIWTTMQAVILLGIGYTKYFMSKMYVVTEFRDRINFKSTLIDEFLNAKTKPTEGEPKHGEQFEQSDE